VAWIFQARIDGHTYKRIARALNDTAVPCPSAADPERNTHRTGLAWTEGAVREILLNPVYTGYSVWGRERTERILIDPDNPALGNRKQRVHTTPDQWTFSKQPTHPALISEHDFLEVQTKRAAPAQARHDYRLTGLLACGVCGRRMEGAWSHGNPAYRCRHGKTSATAPEAPVNTFIRERDLLARFPLLHARLEPTQPTGRATTTPAPGRRTKASSNTAIAITATPSPEEVIDYLRQRALVLSYDPRTRTLEADSTPPARVTV
jgi:site-specific DNA recombinase